MATAAVNGNTIQQTPQKTQSQSPDLQQQQPQQPPSPPLKTLPNGRLLVATLVLPDTISFQVSREKDGRFRSKGSPTANASTPTLTTTAPAASPTTAAAAATIMATLPAGGGATTATSNGKLPSTAPTVRRPSNEKPASSHASVATKADQQFLLEMANPSTGILAPPPLSKSSGGSYYGRGALTPEAVSQIPKPISNKADRLKEHERPTIQQRHSFHGQLHSPPPSILSQPDKRDRHGSLFPTSPRTPTLTQPRSRTARAEEAAMHHNHLHNHHDDDDHHQQHETNHPMIQIQPSLTHRRTSLDSAKVFAEAPWTVERSHGGNIGLQNAINSIQGQLSKRIWIGTLGMATDALTDRTRGDIRAELALNHSSIPVFVHDHDFEGHYHQFCKQVLWPIFHYVLPDNLRSKTYEDGAWKHYVAVNRAFADTIVENYMQGDTIWINDYHLMLVPNMVRERLPDASIGFFLHIPFPSSEIFRCLHVRKEVLEGLLGADLVGFQTYSFARHFLQTCSRILSVESSPKGIQLENTAVNIGIFPIGIDTKTLNIKRKDPEVAQWVKLLKEKYAGLKLIVARDKLDYIKGVRQKMLAFEKFLDMYPQHRGQVVLIQVALSTSEQNEMQGHVSDVVQRINSKFSSLSYQPIVFLRQDITFSQYLGLLTAADLCLITSLRDGMNLTSHEYVVCQEETKNPLVLSEFAGTYGSLGACLRVNPWNCSEVATAIHDALTMSEEEKVLRWNELNKHVCTNTAQYWANAFVHELAKVHSDVQRRYQIHIPLLDMNKIVPIFKSAKRRLLFFDYDGTLIPYDRQPIVRQHGQTSHADMIQLVSRLASDPANIIYIMSGRTRESLERNFSSIANIGLCAEGGCFLRAPGKKEWDTQVQDIDMNWRKKVMEMFEYYKERTPGSEIEEKTVPLVWHYRKADNQSFGLWQARECQNHIEEAIGSIYPVHAIVGRKCLEVMPKDVSKAVAAKTIFEQYRQQHLANPEQYPAIDFVLAMGDDRSDEELFQYCNGLAQADKSETASEPVQQPPLDEDKVVTCTVGSKGSEARWFVPGVSSVIESLAVLAQ
ncbi:hypothetical protein BGW41_002225 [Actinomortierella wolfii]|nr:hypothetical protein BGW41_002225 [Actinomortierella wolfii]